MSSTLTRRALVATGAALPVVALPATSSATADVDPIYAAIERHKEAYQRFDEAAKAEDALGLDDPDDPVWLAADKAVAEASDQEIAVAWDLIHTEPTTIAGAIALLTYVADFLDYDYRAIGTESFEVGDGRTADAQHFLYRTLANALRKMEGATS